MPDHGCDVLHVGSIATVLEPGADTVLEAVRAHRGRALVSLDPNARPAITPDRAGPVARVEELVSLSDVVKVSDEDLHWLHPGVDPVETATRWAALGPDLVAVTRGGDGAIAVRPDGTTLEVPGVPVTVADTVGAGDTFSGVLVDALLGLGVRGADALRALSDRDVLDAVTTAAIGAAVNVSRPGANPPSRAELDAALGQGDGVTEQVHDIGRRRAWTIWAVALAVYVLAVFHRSSLGVAGIIASERFDISATSLATFTVLQLVVYAAMQVPVGVLLDRYGSRAHADLGVVADDRRAARLRLLGRRSPRPSRPVPCWGRATRWCS